MPPPSRSHSQPSATPASQARLQRGVGGAAGAVLARSARRRARRRAARPASCAVSPAICARKSVGGHGCVSGTCASALPAAQVDAVLCVQATLGRGSPPCQALYCMLPGLPDRRETRRCRSAARAADEAQEPLPGGAGRARARAALAPRHDAQGAGRWRPTCPSATWPTSNTASATPRSWCCCRWRGRCSARWPNCSAT